MAIVDFSDFDPMKTNQEKKSMPGKALLMLSSAVEKDSDKGPYYLCTFDVVAHENPAWNGEEYDQFMSLGGKAARGTVGLARALGVLTDDMIKQAKAVGTDLELKLEQGFGNFVCGEIKEPKKDSTYGPKIWNFYAPDSFEAQDYPKKGDKKPAPTQPAEENAVPVVDTPQAAGTFPPADDEIPF